MVSDMARVSVAVEVSERSRGMLQVNIVEHPGDGAARYWIGRRPGDVLRVCVGRADALRWVDGWIAGWEAGSTLAVWLGPLAAIEESRARASREGGV